MTDSAQAPLDALKRPIHDLRISLIDRCNLRCTYCMPAEIFGPDFAFLPRKELLSFDEILLLVKAFARAGVSKIRLTGGEPLLRPKLPELIEKMRQISSIEDIALTTNAMLLKKHVASLRDAGLSRVNVSLDALDEGVFKEMSGGRGAVDRVLEGIQSAVDAGVPAKVNMVVERGVNETEILPMAAYFKERGITLRFIEFMDVGSTNDWNRDKVFSSKEILDTLQSRWHLEAVSPSYRGEVAKRWAYSDGSGEIGIISSISDPFCGDCSRARISADGKLYTCLFASLGYDFKNWIRSGESEDQIFSRVCKIWGARADRYSELRATGRTNESEPKVEMSYIGG
ncbi:MAG: GTP 3',8-cyclase MoaA [Opitutales bacterium]